MQGEAYGQTQLSCDKAFLADMKSTCQQASRHEVHLSAKMATPRFFSDGILTSRTMLCEGVTYNYSLSVPWVTCTSKARPGTLTVAVPPLLPVCRQRW